MRIITESEKQALWEEVRREFPEDQTMQEIHFARLLHSLQTQGMSAEERARFYAEQAGIAPV